MGVPLYLLTFNRNNSTFHHTYKTIRGVSLVFSWVTRLAAIIITATNCTSLLSSGAITYRTNRALAACHQKICRR